MQVGLLSLKDSDGCLSLLVLSLLRLMVPAHLLLRSAYQIFVSTSSLNLPANVFCKRLSDLICLLGELLFELDFFATKSLNLITVEVELLGESLASLLKTIDLALQGRVVGVGLGLAHVGSHRCHLCQVRFVSNNQSTINRLTLQ